MAYSLPDHRLSPMQRTVLIQAARGREVRETAADLGLSASTIRQHRKNLMERMETHSITHALGRAVALGIIAPEDINESP